MKIYNSKKLGKVNQLIEKIIKNSIKISTYSHCIFCSSEKYDSNNKVIHTKDCKFISYKKQLDKEFLDRS